MTFRGSNEMPSLWLRVRGLVLVVGLALVAGLVLVACTIPSPSPVAPADTAPSQSATPVAARAEASRGRYRLVFELPKSTWSAGEPITGTATLSLIGGGQADIGASGSGITGFHYQERGGRHDVEPVLTADCTSYRVSGEAPIVEPLGKSGGFTGEDPDAAFLRSFLAGPNVLLPAGDWQVTAIADFIDGRRCQGEHYLLEAPVVIHVVP